ncbi:hypothetical protein BBP29_17000 [Alteromonas macleodii]|nr:hypothetical protein [Alteromonas macleodii]OZB97543.1 hypothetical protein BBP29_17000 [Alteromonas macleodii]
MKLFLFICFFLLSGFISKDVKAWEPCKPFCDSQCSAKAISNMGRQITNDVSQLTSSCSEFSRVMFDVNTSFQNLAIEWNTTQIEKVEAEITAWDGLANKVLLNDLVTVKYFTTLSEQLVYSIQGALKASTKIRSFQYTSSLFSEQSLYNHPLAGNSKAIGVLSNAFTNESESEGHFSQLIFESSKLSASSSSWRRKTTKWLEEGNYRNTDENFARFIGVQSKDSLESGQRSPSKIALLKLISIIKSRQIERHKKVNESLDDANILTVINGETVDSILRGSSLNDLVTQSNTALVNEHYLRTKSIHKRNEININLKVILEIAQEKALLKSTRSLL